MLSKEVEKVMNDINVELAILKTNQDNLSKKLEELFIFLKDHVERDAKNDHYFWALDDLIKKVNDHSDQLEAIISKKKFKKLFWVFYREIG